jgi:hypothetical protein
MSSYGVVLFHTNAAGMRAEKTLAGSGVSVKLVPTPRELSSDCGIALRFDWGDAELVRAMLENFSVPFAGIYTLN